MICIVFEVPQESYLNGLLEALKNARTDDEARAAAEELQTYLKQELGLTKKVAQIYLKKWFANAKAA